MPLDAEFLATAQTHFNPYSRFSGTEHIGPLLYALARMTRPRVIVEYGSGYSTLFILRALADNMADFAEERRLLIEKTRRILSSPEQEAFLSGLGCRSTLAALTATEAAAAQKWLESGRRACGVDPQFYLETYSPRLLSIEQQPESHPYVRRMAQAVHNIGHQELFTHICGKHFRETVFDSTLNPIDWAWNDVDSYYEFFLQFWERVNPAGGLLIFHNVPSDIDWYTAVQNMKRAREAHGDLEVLILEEPHKLSQNGCAILRRTSAHRPRFLQALKPADMMTSLSRLLQR